MILAFVLAQAFAMTPLPAEVEPHLERYGRCLAAAMDGKQAMLLANPQPGRAATSFDQAKASCAQTRAEAIEASLTALAGNAAFADMKTRKAFVLERFEGADALLKASYTGEFDPGKWSR